MYLPHEPANDTATSAAEKRLTCPHVRAGLLKTQALRGTAREVQTDERTAYAFDMAQASTEQLLQWVYPPLYPIHDTSSEWGKPDKSGRCVLSWSLLHLEAALALALGSPSNTPCA